MMNDHACRHQTISIYLIEDRGFCRGHKYYITTGTIYTIEVYFGNIQINSDRTISR